VTNIVSRIQISKYLLIILNKNSNYFLIQLISITCRW